MKGIAKYILKFVFITILNIMVCYSVISYVLYNPYFLQHQILKPLYYLFPSFFTLILSVLIAIRVLKSNSIPSLLLITFTFTYLLSAGINSVFKDHCVEENDFPFMSYTIITWVMIAVSAVLIYRFQINRLTLPNKLIILLAVLSFYIDSEVTSLGLIFAMQMGFV